LARAPHYRWAPHGGYFLPVRSLTTKAVILARGLGTRMRKGDKKAVLEGHQAAVAAAGLKGMMPLGGRPFLDYIVSALADAGYQEVCLVIGPDRGVVRDHFERDAKPRRIRISYAIQDKPLGTADAVLAVEQFAGDDHFLVINSDNYYPVEAYRGLRTLETAGIAAFWRKTLVTAGNLTAERVAGFPIVEVDEQGFATRLVEASEAPKSDADALISMNCWLFTPKIFPACHTIQPSANGELEIQAAVRHAMANFGERFKVLPFREPVLDLTTRGDVAVVTERLAGARVML
jgi:glucose-1-phosphate thymidylyltransferase